MTTATIPSHVPDYLVRDIDVYNIPGMNNGVTTDDIHQLWKNVQDTCPPVFWTPHYGGHWVVTRFEDLRRVASEYENFSNAEMFVPQGIVPMLTPTQLDPPEHSAYRRLLTPAFTPGRLRAITEEARAAVVAAIEDAYHRGRCEFVTEISGAMPTAAFLTLVDLPVQDGERLRRAFERAPAMDNPEESRAAWAEISAYVQQQIDERIASPREDFISSLIRSEVDGRRLRTDEVFSMCLLLLSASLDTTASLTTFVARFLAEHPAHRAELIDNPEFLNHAVEEFCRRFGLTQTARLVRHDVELNGAPLRKGDIALAIFAVGGLDETVNANPMAVDFARRDHHYVTFGHGPHSCVGMRLAKLELKIFLEEWLKRIPDFRVADGAEVRASTGVLSRLTQLDLQWATTGFENR
ncbi:cytochrome P450 [Nocardia aobensis]|uniref:Cytochrome P450 n=1 Tax=Nocardia aobensis TaxID=257277 RepID=A0ABW6P9J4_9NOCA